MVWEERWHPLREEWVIVAAHRQDRPWQGARAAPPREDIPPYASDCRLCPGNERVGAERNPHYTQTYVFANDHPCVAPDAPPPAPAVDFYRSRPARGVARVLCYSPRHDLAMAELGPDQIVAVMRVWQSEYLELGARPEVACVLAFENRGEAVGVSNPHPHGQIYATNFVFRTIETEVAASRRHLAETGRVLFQDVLAAEAADGRRIICENAAAVAFVPYFARHAYEVYVAPKRTHPSVASLADDELHALADVLHRLLVKFDNLWRMPFPYAMVLHQAPTDGGDHRAFHFHIQFHPPMRKPHLLKFLGGPEIGGGNFLSDTAPEEKAAELRAAPDVHYKTGR